MFSVSKFDQNVFEMELDSFARPGSVKLEQVMFRTFVNSLDFANGLDASNQNPSMERKISRLDCRYRLSNHSEDQSGNLLSEYQYFHSNHF